MGNKKRLPNYEELNILVSSTVDKAIKMNKNYIATSTDDLGSDDELEHFNFKNILG